MFFSHFQLLPSKLLCHTCRTFHCAPCAVADWGETVPDISRWSCPAVFRCLSPSVPQTLANSIGTNVCPFWFLLWQWREKVTNSALCVWFVLFSPESSLSPKLISPPTPAMYKYRPAFSNNPKVHYHGASEQVSLLKGWLRRRSLRRIFATYRQYYFLESQDLSFPASKHIPAWTTVLFENSGRHKSRIAVQELAFFSCTSVGWLRDLSLGTCLLIDGVRAFKREPRRLCLTA